MAAVAPIRDIDRGWRDLLKRLASGKTEVSVGIHAQDGQVPKKSAHPDDNPGSTLLDVAAAHEFGLGVPRRSFIADWQDENADRHQKQIAAMAKAIIRGTVPNAEVAAQRLANLWVGEVQKRIVAGISPPLSPITVRRKKSSTPLIDTGQLRSSVAYAVNGKLHPSREFEQATRARIKAEKKAAKNAASERKKAIASAKKSAKKAINSALRDLKKSTKTAAKKVRSSAMKGVKAAKRQLKKRLKKKRKPRAKKKSAAKKKATS